MIRVVLDTNIFVSALLQPQGPPAQVLLRALAGTAIQICVSGEVYAEYEEVIRRPRLRRTPNEIENALRAVRDAAFWVRPNMKVRACADPDDDIFLECAVAAQAGYVVTGNLKDFPPTWGSTQIVSARQMLEVIADIEDQPESKPPRPT